MNCKGEYSPQCKVFRQFSHCSHWLMPAMQTAEVTLYDVVLETQMMLLMMTMPSVTSSVISSVTSSVTLNATLHCHLD